MLLCFLFFSFTYKRVLCWCVPHSDDCGLHLPCIHLSVDGQLASLRLPVAVGGHLGQDFAALLMWRGQAAGDTGQLQADGGTAGFSEGGAVVAEVAVNHWLLSPAEFAAVGPPLSPLPFDSCLGLCANNEIQLV